MTSNQGHRSGERKIEQKPASKCSLHVSGVWKWGMQPMAAKGGCRQSLRLLSTKHRIMEKSL